MITKEPKFINHVGREFEKLVVLKFGKIESGKFYWLCRCDCGTKVFAKMSDLVEKNVTDCGQCVERKSIYKRWRNMNERCNNPEDPAFKYYGARGIDVCEEWRDFENFFEWAFDSGYSNELQIDRTDNDKGYSPANCRWVTRSENQSNKRNNVWVEIDGKRQIVAAWCKEFGISPTEFARRMANGWEGSDLLLPPGTKRKIL